MRLKFLLITLCCLASVQLSAQKVNTTNPNDNNLAPKENSAPTIDKEQGCIFPTVIEIKKQVPNPMYHPGNSVDGLVLKGDFLRRHPTRMK